MIRLFLWFCTLLGFVVVWVVGAFLTQNYWLAPLISNRIAPFGVEFNAQEIRWLPEWPLRVKARQIVVSYLDGEIPRDLLRGSEFMIVMEGIPWADGAWQIRRVEASFDEICWAPHRVIQQESRSEGGGNAGESTKRSSSGGRKEGNRFSLFEYQFQLTRLSVHSSRTGVAPAVYLLNLNTPVVRGPFTEWGELYRGVLPGKIQLNR